MAEDHPETRQGFLVDEHKLVSAMLAAAYEIPIEKARAFVDAEDDPRASEAVAGMRRASRAALTVFCEAMTTWGFGQEGKPS